MSTEKRWYQKFRCRNCSETFTQSPALLGCVREHGVHLLWASHRPEYDPLADAKDYPDAVESMNWVHTHVSHPCSETESGIADLVGFTTEASQVKDGEIGELQGDDIPAHLRT